MESNKDRVKIKPIDVNKWSL